MSFRIALIYQDDRVYVEFKPKTFKQMLRTYFAKTKDIDKALDQIIVELKNQTKYS
jgi:uncharacterized protein YaaN involved in tellurite resistance